MKTKLGPTITKAYWIEFLMNLHFMGGVLVPFFIIWGKLSFFQITVLQSWYMICSFILEIPTGVIADYLSRKTSVALGCLANILGVLIYSSVSDFYVFLLAEFFWALSAALFSGAYEALIYDELKANGQEDQSKIVFGRLSSYRLIAFGIGAPLGSFIVTYLGMRWVMASMAIPFTLAFLLIISLKENPPTDKPSQKPGFAKILSDGFKALRERPALRNLTLNNMLAATICFFIIWTYQSILKNLGVDLIYFGWIHTLLALVQAIIARHFALLEKLSGSKRRYLFLSCLIPGLGFILLGFNNSIVISIMLILAISGFGLSRPTLVCSYLQKHIDSENRATVMSFVAMARKILNAICYPIIGYLVEWSLDYSLIMLGIALIAFSQIPKIKESYLID